MEIRNKTINVIGDSLKTILFCRKLLSLGAKSVNLYTSGRFGGVYCDKIKGKNSPLLLFSEEEKNRIQEYYDGDFIETTSTYVSAPSKKIPFELEYDEYFKFPITKKTFLSKEEYDENIINPIDFTAYKNLVSQKMSMNNILKFIFSDKLYNNIIKKIYKNMYKSIITKLTPPSVFFRHLRIDNIKKDGDVPFYYPVDGIYTTCKKILGNKVNVKIMDARSIKKSIDSSNELFYVCDYIDYYFGFMYGALDYISIETKCILDKSDISEIYRIDTPYEETYQEYKLDRSSYKCKSKLETIKSNNFGDLLLVPSVKNSRLIRKYENYSDNNLRLKVMF